jgi:polyhydroxybutyrate depolymerase
MKSVLTLLSLLAAIVISLYFYFVFTMAPVFPVLNGEFSKHILHHDGLDRSYSLYKPKALSEDSSVVFVLHGSRGSGNKIRELTAYEFDLLAEQNNLIVVYPDGFDGHWNDCRGSADYQANLRNIDDTGFLASIIESLVLSDGIDRQQVFVTGFSNGGQMVYRLAMEQPEMFSAYAAIAANLPVTANLDCTPKNVAVSMAIFNGTNDPINPNEGGIVGLFGNKSRGEVLSSGQTADYWRTLAALPNVPERIVYPEVDGHQHTRVIQMRWYQSDTPEVRFYSLEGSGHVIPSKLSTFPRFMGGEAGDISGPKEIVQFFLENQ